MSFQFHKRPDGIRFSALSEKVFDALAEHTSFPWPILQAQANRLGIDPASLSPADLERLIPYLASAVARFTSPEREKQVERRLRDLIR